MTEMTEMDVVLTHDADHVRVVTMNRPEKLNAFNQELMGRLGDVLAAAAEDDDVHVVVLTGAGRAFSAGADLSAPAGAGERGRQASEGAAGTPFDRLQQVAGTFPKPLVAAVNGVGVGLGFTILGYCDFTFIAAGARLRTPFIQLGLSPEASSSLLFPLKMGWQNAAFALLAGEWFDAERAVASGIAARVCPDSEVLGTAVTFATELARGPLQSLLATKGLMLEASRSAVAQAHARETETLARLVGTPANREAVAAFRARSAGAP